MASFCRRLRLSVFRFRTALSLVPVGICLILLFLTAASTINAMLIMLKHEHMITPVESMAHGFHSNTTTPRTMSALHLLDIVNSFTNQTTGGAGVLLSNKSTPHIELQASGRIHTHNQAGKPSGDLHNFSYVINNRSLCHGPRLRYVIYVHSAPKNYRQRMSLRETWAQVNLFRKHPSRLVFFLGRSDDSYLQELMRAEGVTYGDIVQEDFKDDYKNLTRKAIGALNWLSIYCHNTDYVFKVDDDTYVNIFLLIKLLTKKYRRQRRFILCLHWAKESARILRDPASCGKWCVSPDEFRNQIYYPQFCSGHAYFMTGDIVPELYEASKTTRFFWVDDVYVTGLLAAKVGPIQYFPVSHLFSSTKDGLLAAELRKGTGSITGLTVVTRPGEIRMLWKQHIRRLPQTDISQLAGHQYARLLREAFET